MAPEVPQPCQRLRHSSWVTCGKHRAPEQVLHGCRGAESLARRGQPDLALWAAAACWQRRQRRTVGGASRSSIALRHRLEPLDKTFSPAKGAAEHWRRHQPRERALRPVGPRAPV